MISQIESRTKNRVKFNIFWGGSLLSAKEQLKGVAGGIADGSNCSPTWDAPALPLWTHAQLFLQEKVSLKETADRYYLFLNTFPEFQQETRKQNVQPFSAQLYSTYNLFSNKLVQKLEDFKGMKIRGVGPYANILLKAVGATNIDLVTGDVYGAMQKNTIDGVEFSSDVGQRYSTYEVAKYLILTGRAASKYSQYVLNLDTWNRFPADIQKIIMDVGKEASYRLAQRLTDDESALQKVFKEAGVKIIAFPQADMDRWDKMPEVAKLKDAWIEDMVKLGYSREMATRVMAVYK